jgi:redox-sensitive bicupin YhaK (pirin superfamily)
MTAGRGILHAEMPCSEEPAHGLQLWVNLRRSEKMVAPQYQELKSEEIPKPTKDGVTVAVISGEALGIKVCHTCCVSLKCEVYGDIRVGVSSSSALTDFIIYVSQWIELLHRY